MLGAWPHDQRIAFAEKKINARAARLQFPPNDMKNFCHGRMPMRFDDGAQW